MKREPLLPFRLIVEDVPALAELGVVQLRELGCGALKRAFLAVKGEPNVAAIIDEVLAQALTIDGEPIGRDGLDMVPGHLLPALNEVTNRCAEIHLPRPRASAAPPDEDEPPPEEDDDHDEDDREGAPPPGEAPAPSTGPSSGSAPSLA
jgi:hypothetical protein